MAPENISSLDNSAIYSGLGLDISPSSSPEGSPSDNDETSIGLQESNLDSPSFIVKMMTSIPFSSNELLSPLQDSLINLKDKADYVGIGLSETKEALPVSIVQENTYLKGKKEERKDKKSKVVKDTSKVKRSKQKEASEERKLKQKAQSQKPMELMKENVYLDATKREDNGVSLAKAVVSNAFISEVGAYSEEKGCTTSVNKNTASKSSIVFDKRNGVGYLGEDIDFGSPGKQVHVVRQKANDEPVSAKRHVVDDDENGVTSLGKTEDRSSLFVPRSDAFTEKREESGWKEDEANKLSKHVSKHIVKEEVLVSVHSKDKNFVSIPKSECSSEKRNEGMKQRNMTIDHVKEEVMDSGFVQGKENGFPKTIPKDEEVSFISEKDAYNHVSQEMKYDDVEKVESLKQKSRSKELTHGLAEQGLPSEKDTFSSAVKTKLKDSQIGVSSVSKTEGVNSRINMPPKSNKGDADQQRKMRRNNEVASTPNSRKKGKERSSKEFGIIGLPEQETQTSTKLKDKSSGMKTSFASNLGSNIEGDLSGIMTEKAPIVDGPAIENVTYVEDWVACERCHKWRLLPLGMSAASLTEIWTCSMITWLPGMNKCSFSEDDTTNALRASYVPVDSTLPPNKEPGCQDGRALSNVPARALDVALPTQGTGFDALSGGGRKKNLAKTNMDSVRQSSVQDFNIPVKKDQVRSDLRNLKNLKKLPRESTVRKSGDGRQSKLAKKRLADGDAYGVSKKTKRVRDQSIEACDPGTLRVCQNFAKESPKYPQLKTKIRSQSDMISKDDGMYNEPGKKRKLKDRDKQQREFSTILPSNKGGHVVSSWDAEEHSGNEHRNEKKSKPLKVQSKESSLTKGQHRTQSDDAIANLGGRSDERFHMDRLSRKGPSGRKSEMALDLGLSDNATTSSSSKISCKVKAKVNEVKSSPVGSSSSSPLKASKPDLNKSTSKKSSSYSEQRLRFGAENAVNECPPSNDRKSNLSRNPGVISDTVDDDQFVKKPSSGRPSSSHVGAPSKLEDHKDSGGKLDPLFEGTSKSPHNLHLEGTNTNKGKPHASKICSEKEVLSNAHDGREFGKPSRQVVGGHVNSWPSQHSGPTPPPSDIEASSSRKNDSLHRAANTALKEAKDLKHSANRLKVSGSGLESTGVSFQAALKFLHGASLLEPGNSESRSGEMTPNEVYASTAKLCENCALEYERSNDMASAALAYKCMEVAYMRLVYCNDLTASRDRQELQMAVRVAPQVESPSSSASDIDNLNQVGAADFVKDGHSAMDLRSHVVSAGNRPNFMRLLDFTHDINLAMEASRRSQSAFAIAMPVLAEAGNVEGITSIKRVLDFSFHDVDALLHLVRLALESIKC